MSFQIDCQDCHSNVRIRAYSIRMLSRATESQTHTVEISLHAQFRISTARWSFVPARGDERGHNSPRAACSRTHVCLASYFARVRAYYANVRFEPVRCEVTRLAYFSSPCLQGEIEARHSQPSAERVHIQDTVPMTCGPWYSRFIILSRDVSCYFYR